MIQIIKERQRVEVQETYLKFDLKEDPNSGFVFPCDANGTIKKSEHAQMAQILCDDDQFEDGYIWVEKRYHYEPAVGICYCGAKIKLTHDYCECEECGRHYNIYGQELVPREYWEEDYEDLETW